MKAGSTIENLVRLIQQAAISRLRVLSHRKDISIKDAQNDQLVFAHWMSLILLSGKSVRVTFKAHFMTDTARFFASRTFACAKEDVSKQRALDFFREFCNLTAGHVKVRLAENDVRVGVSLPALARGFDEVFYPRPKDSVIRNWRLVCEDESVVCTAHIDVYESFDLSRSPVGRMDSEDGDVLFL